jgi:hypothetical protein
MIRIVAVVYVSYVALVTDLCNDWSTCDTAGGVPSTWRHVLHRMALKTPRVAPLDAAREFGLHRGLHNTPPKHELARCHVIHCRRQGLECAPSRVVQPNDASPGTFFTRKWGLKTDRMALGHTAPDPDGAAPRILAPSRIL